jgi:glutaredoxin
VKVELTLLTKPGCHLCDDARGVVTQVVEEFLEAVKVSAPTVKVEVVEQNILDDAALQKRYAEEIPVLLIGGKVHNYWRIDPVRLRAALDAQLDKPQVSRNQRCVGGA